MSTTCSLGWGALGNPEVWRLLANTVSLLELRQILNGIPLSKR